jgi:hypothetical protein
MKNLEPNSKSPKSTPKKNTTKNSRKYPNKPNEEIGRQDMEFYLNMATTKHHPMPMEKVIAIAQDLYYMLLEKPKMTALYPWRQKHGITEEQVSRWSKRYPEFQTIYRECLQLLGDKRDDLAAWKKMDSGHVKYTLPVYCKRARDVELFRGQIKAAVNSLAQPLINVEEEHSSIWLESAKGTHQTVMINKCPETDVVPTKVVPGKTVPTKVVPTKVGPPNKEKKG